MELKADGLDGLPLETRLLRYHEMSEEAARLAETATTDVRRHELITIAENWRLLAEETERTLRGTRPLNAWT